MPGTRRLAGCVLGALLAPAAAAPVHAQDAIDEFLGRSVADVRLQLEDEPLTDPALLSLVEVETGAPLSATAVRATVDHFAGLPQFERVVVFAETGASGLTVTFRLEPRHPIERVEIRGDPGLPAAALERRLREQYGGLPPPDVNLNRVATLLETFLRDEGYLQSVVACDLAVTHDPDRATLVVDVTAGPRATIASVEVVGQSPFTADEVVRRTATNPGQPYRSTAITTALLELRDDLRRRRYYAALASSQAQVSVDRTQVDLTLVVEAGSLISVEFAGDPLPAGDVADFVPVQREGAADEDLLEDADRAIRDALRAEGYRDAGVAHRREERQGETVITFTIRRGRLYRIDEIAVPDSLFLSTETVLEELGLEPNDALDSLRVEEGMARVIDQYRRLGFYDAEAAPQYEEIPDRSTASVAWVILHPNITEGPRGRIVALDFEFPGGQAVPEAELLNVMRSRVGAPFVTFDVYLDRLDLETFYQDRGFRTARVDVEPVFGAEGRDVSLRLRIIEGPQLIVGQITVVGNERVSEPAILNQLTFGPGDPYGQAAVFESRQRLRELGIRRADFTEQARLPGDDHVHVIVAVEELPATTLGLGGGLEAGTRPRSAVGGGIEDQLEISPRGFIEIGRRHLGGRNRSVNMFARLALKPRDAPGDPERDGKGFGFTEYRVTGTFRERRAFNTETDLLVGVTAEQAVRTTFNFIRYGANAEFLRQLGSELSVSGRYALEFTKLFDERFVREERSLIDRLFPQVRLSIVSFSALWDGRDSPIGATDGWFLGADVETALRPIGSEVGYAKTFLQASNYTPLSQDRRFVLASRAQLGLARGFRRKVLCRDEQGNPATSLDGGECFETVQDVPASQRFFAGGSTTIRGFQLDRLGVREILNADGLSNGGNAVVVLNAELRSVVRSGIAVVGFVDSGNVFEKATDVDLQRLRGTAGFGVRYDSPIGPLRLDVGFKMQRFFYSGRRERGWEVHLSLGEAF